MAFPHILNISEEETFNTYSNERVPVGTRAVLEDGRTFRFAENGAAALVAPKLNQAVVHTTNWSDEACGTMAAGVYTITGVGATTGGATADLLKYGYFYSSTAASLFPIMRIKSNTAITAGAATGTITLFSPLPVAIAAATTCGYIENPWRDVIVKPASANTSILVGVNNIAVSANYYGWLQTKGPVSVLYDSSTTAIAGIGDPVGPDQGVAGAVSGLADGAPDTDNIIGSALGLVEGDGEQTVIMLDLE